MNWALTGSLGMFFSVGLGAFAAHALKSKLSPEMMGIFEIGVRYQVYHSLALLFLPWFFEKTGNSQINIVGYLFLIGIVLFSGSLYVLAVSGNRYFGAITPLGGLCFLIGWGFLSWKLFHQKITN